MRALIVHLCLAASVALGVGTALAQQAPAEPGGAAAEEAAARPKPQLLEEVRVTARKKAGTEAVQDVPISVSAFSGNFLEENFVEDLTDIGRSAPNVQLSDVGTFPGTANFSIRGQGIFSSIVSDEPVVGIFVDGIYAGMNVGAIHDLFELEMVEVLRGPQGTLFGRNVTGGAIHVRTRRPSGEFGIRGRATIGSFSRSDFALTVEAPIGETFAWKIDLLSKDRNGVWDTPFVPGGGETGHSTSWTFRPMFSWQATEDLMIHGIYEVQALQGDGNPVRLVVDGGPNNISRCSNSLLVQVLGVHAPGGECVYDRGPNLVPGVIIGRGCQTTTQVTDGVRFGCKSDSGIPGSIPGGEGGNDTVKRGKGDIGNFDTQQSHRGAQTYRIQRATLEANWDVGPGTLTAIGGWRDVENDTDIDVDGTEHDMFQGGPGSPPTESLQWQVSGELRYATQIGERADVTVGTYYFKQDLDYRENRRLLADVFGQGIFTPSLAKVDHQSVAFFAQGDYQLTDRLTATLGTRWTWEEKVAVIWPSDVDQSILGQLGVPGFTPVCDVNFTSCVTDERRRADQDTWNYWSRHAGLRYQVSDDVLLYGTYTRSFRAGGYNMRASVLLPFGKYDEERIDAYEVGIKADWLDRTLRTNLAAFYNRGTDIQRTVLEGVIQDQKNAAKAHVAGVEAEVWWLPIEGLTLNSTVGWVDAEYDNFSGVCNGNQETGPCGKFFDVPSDQIPPGAGRELEFAYIPEWTFSAMARYEFPTPVIDGMLALQTSVYWRDNTWGNDQNTVPVDSYTLWDASISFRPASERYTISVFGKNLTEDPYHDWGIIDVFDATLDWSIGMPRTFGVEVDFSY